MADLLTGLALFCVAVTCAYAIAVPVQYLYRAYSGEFLIYTPVRFGLGLLYALTAIICVNPFFEELTIRAYAMTVIMRLGYRPWHAVLASVMLQMSYHLYEGFSSALTLIVIFTTLSVYYARAKQAMPIVVAHFMFDLLILRSST